MYYKERIIGVLTYGLLLLLFALILKKDNSSPKKILFIYTLSLSILAYLYIPNPGYDLERIYLTLSNYYKPMNFSFLLELIGKSFTPTINIFYYFVSKTNYYGLVPFTAALIFYSCVFYIFSDVCNKYKIFGFKRFLFLLFVMSMGTFLEVIANIRCMTAFSMIAYCIYSESYNNKLILKHLPLYFVAGTMHLAALAMIIVRFVIYPLQKKKLKVFYAVIPVVVLGMIYVFFPNYIEQIFFTESYYKENVSYSYLPELILMSTMTIYIVFIKIIHWKDIISSENETKNINYFALILLAIMLLNIDDYSMFHRIGTLHFLINIPLIGKYISLIEKKGSFSIILLVSFIVLFIAGSFGNLCGFKYFIFS